MRLGGVPLKIVTPMRVSEILRAPYLTQRHGTPAATAIGIVAFEKAVILIGVAPVLSLWVFVAVVVGVDLPFVNWLTVVLLVAMGSFTVGGLGAREAVLVLLFPALDPHGLMAGGVVFFVVAKVGVALLGLIWLPGYLKGMIAR